MLVPMPKLEIAVSNDRGKKVIQIIVAAARTGEIGDGKMPAA